MLGFFFFLILYLFVLLARSFQLCIKKERTNKLSATEAPWKEPTQDVPAPARCGILMYDRLASSRPRLPRVSAKSRKHRFQHLSEVFDGAILFASLFPPSFRTALPVFPFYPCCPRRLPITWQAPREFLVRTKSFFKRIWSVCTKAQVGNGSRLRKEWKAAKIKNCSVGDRFML